MDEQRTLEQLRRLTIETPSWGYGDSGTRFATFQQPGRPRDVFERLDDAADATYERFLDVTGLDTESDVAVEA